MTREHLPVASLMFFGAVLFFSGCFLAYLVSRDLKMDRIHNRVLIGRIGDNNVYCDRETRTRCTLENIYVGFFPKK